MPAGLYIHIPFCKSKCIYCDFYSVPRRQAPTEIIDGLITEYNHRKGEIDEPFNTIYIGGGTPSILPICELERLVRILPVENAKEFTIEVNPDDVSAETVQGWKSLGINRISMGVQSLDDNLLHRLGRRHTASAALKAISTIQECGIDNISCDMIYGIPGLSDNDWHQSLHHILSTGIRHLSAYALSYYENTALWRLVKTGKWTPLDDDDVARHFEILRDVTATFGFEHYEISNFAMPGYRSSHNSTYWDTTGKWLGIGPSAHSFDGYIRRVDIDNTDEWLKRLPLSCDIDEETDGDRINDMIVTGLRTLEGLNLSYFPSDIADSILHDAAPFIRLGHMRLISNNLSIDPNRWLIADTYIRELIQDF